MTLERLSVDDTWREKLNAAHESYVVARDAALVAQREFGHLPMADGGYAFRRANAIESAALGEYRRILKIFTALSIRGERPRE